MEALRCRSGVGSRNSGSGDGRRKAGYGASRKTRKSLVIERIMKRYCKNVDITDIGFIESCIYDWIHGKIRRKSVQKFFADYAGIHWRTIHAYVYMEKFEWLPGTINAIAKDVQKRIISKDLQLQPIMFHERYDECCRKWRTIGVESPMHQIMDYIAVHGCWELFRAKIGEHQMASIKGRGQEKGVRCIRKWVRTDPVGTRMFAKCDVYHCFPSIDHDRIKARFRRDLKNPDLLWLAETLIDQFQTGLSIGSFFSQYTCNYYMSLLYHYTAEALYKIRRHKDGTKERVRLLSHQLLYMDDLVLFGSSARDLKMAMRKIITFADRQMGLRIKSEWSVRGLDDGFLDMMGKRIYRDHTAIRRRTFRTARRAFIRAWRSAESGHLRLKSARRVMSYNGIVKYSDSYKVRQKYNLKKLKRISRRIISDATKAEDERRKACIMRHTRMTNRRRWNTTRSMVLQKFS